MNIKEKKINSNSINGLSIIIPIYRENNNIIPLNEKLNKIIKNIKYEVIFVDDNSKDGSHDTLKIVKKKYNIKYYIRRKKRDLMESCFLGIRKSKYKTCLIMDGDLQHNPKYINDLFNKMNLFNYDIGICCRNFFYLNSNNFNFIRKCSSLIIIFFINFLLKKKSMDPLSGFFIFKKKLFNDFNFLYYPRGYKILLNILYCNNTNIKSFDKVIRFEKRVNNKSKMGVKILFNLIIQIFYLLYIRLFKKILLKK